MKFQIETDRAEGTGKRSKTGQRRQYDDACGAAHGLDLVGDRWALLVVRELMLGPKRFTDLRHDLPGISANVLTQRLEELEASSILFRRKLPPPAAAWVYELTEWGYEAEPIFQVLGRWAARSPLHDPTRPIGGTSLMLSFRTMIDHARVGDLRARLGFRFGEEEYVGELGEPGFPIRREPVRGADLIFSGRPSALAAAVYGKVALDELAGALTVEGDRGLAERFIDLFALPPKAPKLR